MRKGGDTDSSFSMDVRLWVRNKFSLALSVLISKMGRRPFLQALLWRGLYAVM